MSLKIREGVGSFYESFRRFDSLVTITPVYIIFSRFICSGPQGYNRLRSFNRLKHKAILGRKIIAVCADINGIFPEKIFCVLPEIKLVDFIRKAKNIFCAL